MNAEHHVELDCEPEAAYARVAREAESWGGEWHRDGAGGRLQLPVVAGLRYGWVAGRLWVESRDAAGSRLVFRVEESGYRVQTASAVVLVIAALGALTFIVAPFVPVLWPLVPLGFMLALGAWLFIVSHLRNSGPEEFLEAVARVAAHPPEE